MKNLSLNCKQKHFGYAYFTNHSTKVAVFYFLNNGQNAKRTNIPIKISISDEKADFIATTEI